MTYPLVKCGETKVRGAVVFIGEPLLRTAEITNRHTITTNFGVRADRLAKSSKYIPKRLLNRVQQMEREKAAVKEILQLLGMMK